MASACPALLQLSMLRCPMIEDAEFAAYLRGPGACVTLRCTRYNSQDLRGLDVTVCKETVAFVFKEKPNEFRAKALERTRRRKETLF